MFDSIDCKRCLEGHNIYNCPRCGGTAIQRERRPDGFTKCMSCNFQASHVEWVSAHQVKRDSLECDAVVYATPGVDGIGLLPELPLLDKLQAGDKYHVTFKKLT
jgi:hypothetical protein